MKPEDLFFELPLAVLDVETTGFSPTEDRVIEVGIITMQRGEVIGRYNKLVNPQRDVPKEVQELTGIDPSELLGAPLFSELADEICAELENKIMVAYNLPFDRSFLVEELGRVGKKLPSEHFIDPLVFVRELHRNDGSKRLGAVAERLGISLENAHRAADDAEATGQILYKILPSLPPTLGELEMLQQQWEIQQQNERAGWRSQRASMESATRADLDRGKALGPAYVYGEETDPIRAMFSHLPDAATAAKQAAALREG